MKIVTIVGARPQFIKAAAMSRILRKYHTEILVHTGQHFDVNMSDIFFEELNIPKPNYNLGINGGTHAEMTGKMLIAIEKVLLDEKPDALMIYGDTNSTVASSLAAVKLHIPIIHIESGTRVGTLQNPEEVNRIITDHISTIRFACVESSMKFLKKEGLIDNTFLVGDPMYDAFLYFKNRINNITDLKLIDLELNNIDVPKEYYYMTCHRQENTESEENLKNILLAMESLDAKTIYPVHPRNKNAALKLKESLKLKNILFVQPVGYLESIYLVSNAKKIVTDSGGVQREAFFANKQCVTILDFICWPETMVSNRNQLSKPIKEEIIEKLNAKMEINDEYKPFGDGHSCQKMCDIINTFWR